MVLCGFFREKLIGTNHTRPPSRRAATGILGSLAGPQNRPLGDGTIRNENSGGSKGRITYAKRAFMIIENYSERELLHTQHDIVLLLFATLICRWNIKVAGGPSRKRWGANSGRTSRSSRLMATVTGPSQPSLSVLTLSFRKCSMPTTTE